MSQHPTANQDDDEATYQAERTAAWETVVEAMTAAVRLTHPVSGPLDFPDFLASALAAVAANVGGTYRLIAGRPGSWEADHVDSLVCGTIGHDDTDLTRHRTEPVMIPLDVHTLMVEDAWTRTRSHVTAYELECDEVYQRHEALPEAEYDDGVESADICAVTTRWAARYSAYAEAFTTAVLAEAAHIDGLHVPVTVEANTDPDEGTSHPSNPDELEDPDPLVLRLWDAARRTVALPGTDDDTAQQVAPQ
jgi:hypothetical protein